MEFHEYIQDRIDASISNGVTHLPEILTEFMVDNGTEAGLESLLQDAQRQEQEAESFSMNHLFYWSLTTHLKDIILHWKLMQE
ncbi:hypothetical protein D3C85_988430 [compost metagenome]